VSLILHVNATEIDYDGLRQLETPPATPTHVPIPHFRVVDLIKTTLGMYGHQVTAENYGCTKDGLRFFGVLSLRSAYTGYEDVLGLRNSHDRSFPVSIGCGSRVFVCGNMAFVAEHQLKRRHTANLKRDLPGVVSELIEPLALEREASARRRPTSSWPTGTRCSATRRRTTLSCPSTGTGYSTSSASRTCSSSGRGPPFPTSSRAMSGGCSTPSPTPSRAE
jgi:hypothetical protein